jgi:hypothetical protein
VLPQRGLRQGYRALYEINEYAHDLTDRHLKDLVLQVTGAEDNSSTVQGIVGSFRALQSFASFDDGLATDETLVSPDETVAAIDEDRLKEAISLPAGLNVGYTINLHLPATSDIAVFNAIFKSLREQLLR